MITVNLVVVFLSISIHSYVNAKCLEQEPLDLVKSLLESPTPMQIETWLKASQDISDNSPETTEIKNVIGNMVQTRAVLKIVEDGFSVLSLPKDTQLTSHLSLPYQNTLTVIASTLNTLLDGFELQTVQEQLKDIELSDSIVIPKDLRHITLLEVFNRVPRYNLEQIGLVNEMNTLGRTAFLTIRDLVANDRWQEAFASIGLEHAGLSERTDNINTTLHDLITFTQSIITHMKGATPPLSADKIPKFVRGSNYAFGWWLNCEKDQSCLIGVLPGDTIISFSPSLRMYIMPSVKTGFIIANTKQLGHNSRTMKDLLNFDAELFSRILRVTSIPPPPTDEPITDAIPTTVDTDSIPTDDTTVNTPSTQEDDDILDTILGKFFRTVKSLIVLYMEFVASQHIIVRTLLWVLFLFVAKLFTSWMYHGIWLVMCKLVKRTHEDRPKRD